MLTLKLLTLLLFPTNDSIPHEWIYKKLLYQYEQGKSDTSFLYDLALTALKAGDTAKAGDLCYQYMQSVPIKYDLFHLNFILTCTNTLESPSFSFMFAQRTWADKIIGGRKASLYLMNILIREECLPFIASQGKLPQWDVFHQHLSTIYGELGEETFLRFKTIQCILNNDKKEFLSAAGPYIEKYAEHISPSELSIIYDYMNSINKN